MSEATGIRGGKVTSAKSLAGITEGVVFTLVLILMVGAEIRIFLSSCWIVMLGVGVG